MLHMGYLSDLNNAIVLGFTLPNVTFSWLLVILLNSEQQCLDNFHLLIDKKIFWYTITPIYGAVINLKVAILDAMFSSVNTLQPLSITIRL